MMSAVHSTCSQSHILWNRTVKKVVISSKAKLSFLEFCLRFGILNFAFAAAWGNVTLHYDSIKNKFIIYFFLNLYEV